MYSSSTSSTYDQARGVRRKEAELRNLRTSVSFRQFRAHRQMGHGHLSSHGLTYFWSSSRFRTAASQRAFSVGSSAPAAAAAGDASQDGINAPGVSASPSCGATCRIDTSCCRGVRDALWRTLSQRSREADRGTLRGWADDTRDSTAVTV